MNQLPVVCVKVREVGQNFGCVGTVTRRSNRHRIHETRVFPKGFNAAAYDAAILWAFSRGYEICGHREVWE